MSRVIKSFFLVVFLLSLIKINAQTTSEGNIEIIQDQKMDVLLQKHISLNEQIPGIEGYRIQIFFESGNYSKRKANEIKDHFMEKFPDIKAYITFDEPYYKIRVGDFRTKIEAQGFLQSIISDFPNAYVVKEDQVMPKLDN